MQWPSEASGVERANKCLVQKSKSRSKSRSKSGKNNRQKEVEGFESRNKVNGKNEHLQSVLNRCQNYTSPRAKKILALGHKISDQSGIRSKFRFVILIMRTVLVRLFVTKSPEMFFFHQMPKNASSWALTRKIIFGRFKKKPFLVKTQNLSKEPQTRKKLKPIFITRLKRISRCWVRTQVIFATWYLHLAGED